MIDLVVSWFRQSADVQSRFLNLHGEDVIAAARLIATAFQQGQKLLIFGNGGSAAEAQHLAAEGVNRFRIERPPLPALALTTDASVLTSVANDYSFDDVFVKQIKALGRSGDIALGISTSGQSANVIEAVKEARRRGLVTVALTGHGGGPLAQEAELALVVPAEETAHIQEVHLMVIHLLMELVDNLLFIQPGQNREQD